MQRALEAGSPALLFPMVDSAAQARPALAAARG